MNEPYTAVGSWTLCPSSPISTFSPTSGIGVFSSGPSCKYNSTPRHQILTEDDKSLSSSFPSCDSSVAAGSPCCSRELVREWPCDLSLFQSILAGGLVTKEDLIDIGFYPLGAPQLAPLSGSGSLFPQASKNPHFHCLARPESTESRTDMKQPHASSSGHLPSELTASPQCSSSSVPHPHSSLHDNEEEEEEESQRAVAGHAYASPLSSVATFSSPSACYSTPLAGAFPGPLSSLVTSTAAGGVVERAALSSPSSGSHMSMKEELRSRAGSGTALLQASTATPPRVHATAVGHGLTSSLLSSSLSSNAALSFCFSSPSSNNTRKRNSDELHRGEEERKGGKGEQKCRMLFPERHPSEWDEGQRRTVRGVPYSFSISVSRSNSQGTSHGTPTGSSSEEREVTKYALPCGGAGSVGGLERIAPSTANSSHTGMSFYSPYSCSEAFSNTALLFNGADYCPFDEY